MRVFLKLGHFLAVYEKSKAGISVVFYLNIGLLPGHWPAVPTKGLSRCVCTFFLTTSDV